MATDERPQPTTQADQKRIGELAVALGAGSAATAAPLVLAVLVPLGIRRAIAIRVLTLIFSVPPSNVAGFGVAGRVAQRQAATYRAAYLLAAARRVEAARAKAQAMGRTQRDAVDEAMTAEDRYYALQRAAEEKRARAAADTDFAAATMGPTLGWYATLDDRTSRECRVAHGGTFTPSAPPAIGLPGAVHPHCRCRPGPAIPGAVSVNAKLAAAGLLRQAYAAKVA